MRITFVALGWEQLGVSLLSALAKERGHDVRLAFSVSLFNDRYNFSIPSLAKHFGDRKDVIDELTRFPPDVIAFSALTGTYQWMLGIAKEAKQLFPRVKIIFGGVHVSAVPERVMNNPFVDYVVVGEGDIAFVKILAAIEQNNLDCAIGNTRFRQPNGNILIGPQEGFIQDLNSLPMFDKTIWEEHMKIGDIYLTMASRGCPYRCTFCFNNFFANLPEGKSGKYVRQRSVDHMMRELLFAKKRYRLKLIEFEDDVFTVDKKWVKNFLDVYKREINVPFQCLTHPRYLDDDVGRWLSEAGCQYIQMGIQTMDDEFKHTTIKRYEKAHHVEAALATMRKYKIKAKVDHMFALPGEPDGAQEEARKLYIRHPPYRIQTFWTNFLPGTELVQQGLDLKLITPEEVERLNDGLGFDFYRNTTRLMDEKKLKLFKAYEVIYKLIPITPSRFRKNLNPQFFAKLPVWLCGMLTFCIDLSVGIFTRNPDHIAYAEHNLFHLARFFARKLGFPFPRATKPQQRKSFNASTNELSRLDNPNFSSQAI